MCITFEHRGHSCFSHDRGCWLFVDRTSTTYDMDSLAHCYGPGADIMWLFMSSLQAAIGTMLNHGKHTGRMKYSWTADLRAPPPDIILTA